MKSETILKINKFGKAGYIICKIGKIALLIAAISCLVAGILTCFIPKEYVKLELATSNSATLYINGDFDFSGFLEIDGSEGIFKLGDNTYKIVANGIDMPETVKTTFYLSNVKWICFAAVIVCVILYVAFYFAEKLCAYFKECETPFTLEISEGLMKLAYSLIGAGLVNSIMESVTESLLENSFAFTLEVDIITVLLILCVFMLSFIFKHGAELQRESDELL